MSYNPTENYSSETRNPSGIVFFGKDPSKPMLDSVNTFLIDEGNSQLKVPNILLSNGDIGVAGNTNAINIASNLVTFATGVQIEGDLVVNGTTVTVNTETVTIDDNILVLNNNATGSATEDAGIEIERGSDSNVQFLWDESNNYWSISDVNGVYYELATRSGVQELLNKTIDGDKNTLLNIPITALDAYSVTVNAGTGLTGGGQVNLGNTITINLAAGNGLTSAADSVSVNAGSGLIADALGVHVIAGTGITSAADSIDLNVSSTIQSVAPNTVSSTTSRTYAVQVDNSDNLVVNVPWTDTSSLTTEEVQDIVAGQIVTNGTHTRISATYDDANDGAIDLVVDGDLSNYSNANSNFFDTAGNGLTSTGSTVSAVGGNGVTVNVTGINVNYDDTTIGLNGSDQLYVKDSGIDTTQLADDSVTEAKLFRAIQIAGSTVTATGDIILASGGGGGITINLPAITSNEGRIIHVKKTDPLAGSIVIDGNGSETIDGALTKRLYYQYESMTLVCDASAGWYII